MNKQSLQLMDVFENRPNRYRLLENGIKRCGWDAEQKKILEIGCGQGDASAYLAEKYHHNMVAVDQSERWILAAQSKHQKIIRDYSLHFFCEDIFDYDLKSDNYQGMYCEAVLSSIDKKTELGKKMFHNMVEGSFLLIHDYFLVNNETYKENRVLPIVPCFQNVISKNELIEMFVNVGFSFVEYENYFDELLRIAEWLCKSYKIAPGEIDVFLKGEQGCFKKNNITYGQMIFRK